MQRYFINQEVNTDTINIIGDDYYHITKVMRMKEHDQVIVCNIEKTWLCEIVMFSTSVVTLKIIREIIENKKMPIEVTIAQGLVTKEKMETVIDNITELGAFCYLPVRMERCNIKINDEKLDKKMIRLRKIAKEAAEQAHRNTLMIIEEPISFKEMLKLNNKYDLCLYAYEKSYDDLSFKEIIKSNSEIAKVIILVGPEGGISDDEVKMLKEANFKPISLGPRILRTEVAPSYIMACISYEKEL